MGGRRRAVWCGRQKGAGQDASTHVFHACAASHRLQACGREEDCLATYRAVEKTHPNPAIRRQAESLRYIMEVRHSRLLPLSSHGVCPQGRRSALLVPPALRPPLACLPRGCC